MVLGLKGPGRVGRCRFIQNDRAASMGRPGVVNVEQAYEVDVLSGHGPAAPRLARLRAERDAPIRTHGPVGVVRDLPGMAVGIDEHARVAAPERLRGLTADA